MISGIDNTVLIAFITLLAAPLALNIQAVRSRRRDEAEKDERERIRRQEDYDRQDEVASRLTERQDRIAAKAEEAAGLLVENNKAVAAIGKDHGAQLKQIHTLVNSSMTAIMEDALGQSRLVLLALMELADYRKSHNEPISEATTKAISEANDSIAKREAELSERLKQTNIAAAQLGVDMKKPS